MIYVIRVNPQGHPDPERGPVGPLPLGEAIRRARQAPDPHSGWRNIAVAEMQYGSTAEDDPH